MAKRRAKSERRTSASPPESTGGERRSPARYPVLALACLGAALVLSLILAPLLSPDHDAERSPAPASRPPPSPVDLPATPVAATIEELKGEAATVAEELISQFPQCPEAYHVMALLQKSLRQTDDARQHWQRCLELDPRHVRARVDLALVAMDQGDDEFAVRTLQAGLSAGSSSPELYHALGTALMRLGMFEKTTAVLQAGLETFPGSSRLLVLLGQASIQRGRLDEAKAALERAIVLSPDYADAYYGLASVCARQRKLDEAANHRERFAALKAHDRQLEDRLALVPDLEMIRQRTAATLCAGGTIYLREADFATAERLLLRAVSVAPGLPETYKALASLYQGQGRITDALVVQRRLVNVDSDNTVNYVNLANLSLRVGDTALAEEVLRHAIQMEPDAALPHTYLGRLCLTTGRLEEARSLAQQSVRLEPTPAGYMLLAAACQGMNDSAAAKAAAEQARRLQSAGPVNPRYRTSPSATQ